jgi:hypothetical protein
MKIKIVLVLVATVAVGVTIPLVMGIRTSDASPPLFHRGHGKSAITWSPSDQGFGVYVIMGSLDGLSVDAVAKPIGSEIGPDATDEISGKIGTIPFTAKIKVGEYPHFAVSGTYDDLPISGSATRITYNGGTVIKWKVDGTIAGQRIVGHLTGKLEASGDYRYLNSFQGTIGSLSFSGNGSYWGAGFTSSQNVK